MLLLTNTFSLPYHLMAISWHALYTIDMEGHGSLLRKVCFSKFRNSLEIYWEPIGNKEGLVARTFSPQYVQDKVARLAQTMKDKSG